MQEPVFIRGNPVLAVLAEPGGAQACLDAAADAAQCVQANVSALHVRVDPMTDILPTEEMLDQRQSQQLDRQETKEGQQLAAMFDRWSCDLSPHLYPEWVEVGGGEAREVALAVKSSMLAVMATIDRQSGGHARQAFHTCMTVTGKPFLVVPRHYRSRPVASILVAWKDRKDSGRAIEAAEPWLIQVATVHLLRIGTQDPLEDDWIREKLKAAGKTVEVTDIPRQTRIDLGDQILAQAQRLQADWIVAGAFHHGETLEWLFGGVSETLVSKADRPVFFMH